MAAVTICSDFGAQENSLSLFPLFPHLYEGMGPDAMILVFWMLSFKPTVSLPFFTFIKRLFSSSLSATRVVPSVYLRLLFHWLGFTNSNKYYIQKYGEYMNKTTYLKPPRFLVQIWYRFNNFKIWFSFEELILIKFEIPYFFLIIILPSV